MPNHDSVGERVRAERRRRKMSQSQLAGSDLSDSYISLIEAGKRTPTSTVVAILAGRLGCPTEFLADGAEPEHLTHGPLRLRQARLALLAGDAEEAQARFLALAERAAYDDPVLAWQARYGQARALERLGRHTAAIASYEELRAHARAHPGRVPALPVTIDLCRCYHQTGDLALCAELGRDVLDRLAALGLTHGTEVLDVASVLIPAYAERGAVDSAIRLGERLAADIAAGPGPRDRCAAGDRAAAHGALADAVYLCENVSSTGPGAPPAAEEAGFWLSYGELLLCRPEAGHPDLPDPHRASAALDRAERLSTALGERERAARCRTGRARAALDSDRPADAAVLASDALVALNPVSGVDTARAYVVLGQSRVRLGDRAAGHSAYRQAGRILADLNASRPAARIWRELGDRLGELDDAAGMADAYRTALACAGLHHPPGQATGGHPADDETTDP